MPNGLSSRSPFRFLSAAVDGALGLIYPRVCLGCDMPLDGIEARRWLCEACERRMHPIAAPYCERCGQGYEGAVAPEVIHFHCSNCADLDLAFDFAIGAFRNEGLARELIHRFKYGRQHYLCAPLGQWLARALEEERLAASLAAGDSWTLVPVPLHRKRLRERGFNQSAELCRVLRRARRESFEIAPALIRTRHTGRQAALDREERLTNLKDAFALTSSRRCRKRIMGRNVLLVDDVMTTGATASECASVLIEEGDAARVVAVSVVRG